MAKDNKFNLDGFEQLSDGSYRKKKTILQPREKKFIVEGLKEASKETVAYWIESLPNESKMRTLKLNLFGIPMPKQSVRAANGHFWQPKETIERKADYQKQIKEQLPEGFKMFETEVHITKFHCIFPPLKSFHKEKGKMEAIRNGEIFYKNTKPDLIDNLKKLCFDSMDGVLKNDSIIVTENDTAKYYGVGGCIILEMKGY